MNILRDALRDLRERRLWPIAAALLLALIAVPAFLSSTAASTPAPSLPSSQTPASTGPAVPVVSVSNTPTHSKLTGRARNPFKPQGSTPNAGSKTSSTAKKTSSSSSGNSSTVKSTTTTSSSATTPPAPTTTTTTTTPAPTAPTGLSDSESYNVALSINNASGGLNAIPSVERLSVLPNPSHPLLVELGVLKGGKRALFAVQPGAVVHGPGRCTPGPIDCQILSLAQGQVESLKRVGAASSVLFAVTAITAQQHGSATAATKLRDKESDAGRQLLNRDTTLPALSLFKYVPSLGAILDLRNVTVGSD